jgi:hypothetical protein
MIIRIKIQFILHVQLNFEKIEFKLSFQNNIYIRVKLSWKRVVFKNLINFFIGIKLFLNK